MQTSPCECQSPQPETIAKNPVPALVNAVRRRPDAQRHFDRRPFKGTARCPDAVAFSVDTGLLARRGQCGRIAVSIVCRRRKCSALAYGPSSTLRRDYRVREDPPA